MFYKEIKKKLFGNGSKIPQNVIDTIPYIAVDLDGVIEVEKGLFSTSIKFADINYQIAKKEDQKRIFLKYCDVLNYFNASNNVQITLQNRKISDEEFTEEYEMQYKNDEYDRFRKELNNRIVSQDTSNNSNIEKCNYVTVSIYAKDMKEAKNQFTRLQNEVRNNLKRVGSRSDVMNLEERLKTLHDVFVPDEKNEFIFNKEYVKKSGVGTKPLIAPDSFDFRTNYFKMGDKYARALFLKTKMPNHLDDRMISEFMTLNKDIILSIHIKPIDTDIAIEKIQNKITSLESNRIARERKSATKGGYNAYIPYDLKTSLEGANELLEDVTENDQKAFLVTLVIVHMADTKDELEEDTKSLAGIASKYLCKLGKLNIQQEEGLKSVLPLGKNYLDIDRLLTTESLAAYMPFNCEELMHSGGMYYGKNAVSGKLITVNRKLLKNGNGFILGTPGGGKSFKGKEEMEDVFLNSDDDLIVIDPDGEYTAVGEAFNAEIIKISANSDNHLNLLDLTEHYADSDEGTEDPITLKSDFILGICDTIMNGLSPTETAQVDRILRKLYAPFVNSDYDKSKIPTLKEFQTALAQNPVTKEIADALEIYTNGSLSVFAHPTNVKTNNRFTIYNTKGLGKKLKKIGLTVVLDAVWNRITDNRSKGKNTWIWIDEFYLLFDDEYTTQYFKELYKRARKWGGIPTGITQNVSDILKSPDATTMISNSEFVVMLNQASSDRESLAELLGISEAQMSYITGANEGEGLLYTGKSIVPFVDNFPKDTELYSIMTTKLDEVKRQIA